MQLGRIGSRLGSRRPQEEQNHVGGTCQVKVSQRAFVCMRWLSREYVMDNKDSSQVAER